MNCPSTQPCCRRHRGVVAAAGPAALLVLAATLVLGACSKGGAGAPPPAPPPAAVDPTEVVAGGGGFTVSLLGEAYASFAVPTLGGAAPTVTVEEASEGWKRVLLRWSLPSAVAQDDLAVRLDLAIAADSHWLPHLAPLEGFVVGEHVFRSPALIAAQGRKVLAVVPDLDLVGRDPVRRAYLDLDAPAGQLFVGISPQSRPIEVLYLKEPGMTFPPGDVDLAFFVRAFEDQETPTNPFRPVRRFLWDRYAADAFASGQPSTVPLDDYVAQTYDWAFGTWEDRLWQEFDLGGTTVGAPLFIVDATWSPHNTGPWTVRETPSVWNQAWFCALRSAMGLRQWAARQGSTDLLRRAELTAALTLAAPTDRGLFPAVLITDPPTVPGPGPEIAIDWTAARWTGSNRVPIERGITRDWYHLADASWTALWMVRWHQEAAPAQLLLDRATAYGERLLQLQRNDGHWPAWLDPTTQAPAAVLDDSVESAVSAWCMLELAEATGRSDFRAAALRALDAVLAGPVAEGRWEDFETYWSNNDLGRATFVGRRIPRNNVYKQNTLGMIWTAGACLEAWRQTGTDSYLQWGHRVVDELCMWQQVWRPPFIHVPSLGGFGAMNADAEWNDARQSLAAELFLDYALATGDDQLWQRGVAALRASFAMMYTPLNGEAQAQWQQRHPFFGPLDRGFTMENYAHYEEPAPDGSGMGDFAIYDWGAGAAAQSWNRVRARLGNVYIDETRGRGFSVEPIDVSLDNGSWTLRDQVGKPRSVRIVFSSGRTEERFLDGTLTLLP